MNSKRIYWLIFVILVVACLPSLIVLSQGQELPVYPRLPVADYISFIPNIIRAGQPPAPTATPTPTTIPTRTATATPRVTPPPGMIVVDHTSVDLFDQIPDNYIQAASQLKMLFRHASVGGNINDGLNCLMNKVQPRPYFCDKNIPPEDVIYHPKYNRDNWTFEFHSPPPNPNPGWWNKENYFIDRIDNLTPSEPYNIAGFKFGYVDGLEGSNIDQKFFNNDPNDNLPSVEELEALERRHPDKVFVYWTMGLARLSYIQSQNFNDQMRSYAIAHEKILMDIGDIESHRPDGTLCYDKDNKGIVAICDEYTDEPEGGHLNALGMQRMAKAVWVLMARLAGWNGGNSPTP